MNQKERLLQKLLRLEPKTYAYLIDGYGDGGDDDDDYEKNKIINKKATGTKKCVIKRELIFKNYKDCLFNDETILRSLQRFKSCHHKVYAEQV